MVTPHLTPSYPFVHLFVYSTSLLAFFVLLNATLHLQNFFVVFLFFCRFFVYAVQSIAEIVQGDGWCLKFSHHSHRGLGVCFASKVQLQ